MESYDWNRHDRVATSLDDVEFAVSDLLGPRDHEDEISKKWAMPEISKASTYRNGWREVEFAWQDFEVAMFKTIPSNAELAIAAVRSVLVQMRYAADHFSGFSDRDGRVARERELRARLVQDVLDSVCDAERIPARSGARSLNAIHELAEFAGDADEIVRNPVRFWVPRHGPVGEDARQNGVLRGNFETATGFLSLAESQADLARQCLTGAMSVAVAKSTLADGQRERVMAFTVAAGLMARWARYSQKISAWHLGQNAAMRDIERPVFLARLPDMGPGAFASHRGRKNGPQP